MAMPLPVREDVGRLSALAIVLAVLVGGCTTARVSSESPAGRVASRRITGLHHHARPARRRVSAGPLAALRRRHRRVAVRVDLGARRSDSSACRAARPLISEVYTTEAFSLERWPSRPKAAAC